LAEVSLQAQIPHNHCFGCGPDNSAGLNLESFLTGEGSSVARFVPQPHHCAAPPHFVNGGIIATVIDCHCICTASAEAYRLENRAIGSTPHLHFATARMAVEYLRPAPIDGPLMLTATIASQLSKGFVVGCKLEVSGRLCATAEVTAIRVGEAWMHEMRTKEEQ
jgi:acyl-coenzyme A thioesterase PaaI-like protein